MTCRGVLVFAIYIFVVCTVRWPGRLEAQDDRLSVEQAKC